MPFAPSVNQNKGVVHSNNPETIIDFPDFVSIAEWGGAQSSAFGVQPTTSYPQTGTGVSDDSAAINAAFVALAGSGISLFFPTGTYLCTANAIVNAAQVPVILAPGAIVTGTYAATVISQGNPFTARAVMTTVATSTTYTGTTTSTLTFGSNAAIGTQDGVSTLAVGDCVILQGGTLGSCAITACDVGPWIISSLGGASAKVVLVRPAWWPVGMPLNAYQKVLVGSEGSVFGGTNWTPWAAIGTLVSATTTDPVFYPDQVSLQATLTASSYTLSTIPLRSATKSTIVCSLAAVGGTTASTVGYGPIAAFTAGYVGTVTGAIVAQAAGMTKNGTSDTSLVSIVVTNRY
jgi:hypothetical protein